MNFPLFLHTRNQKGKKGAQVKLFVGRWLIEWDCPNTRLAISLNDAEPFEINNLHKLTIDSDTTAQLTIIEPDSSQHITAFAGRF